MTKRELPDPEKDFEGFVTAAFSATLSELPQNPTTEFWVARSANRLQRLIKVNAPTCILEQEKRLLQKRVSELPVYCPEFDELNR